MLSLTARSNRNATRRDETPRDQRVLMSSGATAAPAAADDVMIFCPYSLVMMLLS